MPVWSLNHFYKVPRSVDMEGSMLEQMKEEALHESRGTIDFWTDPRKDDDMGYWLNSTKMTGDKIPVHQLNTLCKHGGDIWVCAHDNDRFIGRHMFSKDYINQRPLAECLLREGLQANSFIYYSRYTEFCTLEIVGIDDSTRESLKELRYGGFHIAYQRYQKRNSTPNDFQEAFEVSFLAEKKPTDEVAQKISSILKDIAYIMKLEQRLPIHALVPAEIEMAINTPLALEAINEQRQILLDTQFEAPSALLSGPPAKPINISKHFGAYAPENSLLPAPMKGFSLYLERYYLLRNNKAADLSSLELETINEEMILNTYDYPGNELFAGSQSLVEIAPSPAIWIGKQAGAGNFQYTRPYHYSAPDFALKTQYAENIAPFLLKKGTKGDKGSIFNSELNKTASFYRTRTTYREHGLLGSERPEDRVIVEYMKFISKNIEPFRVVSIRQCLGRAGHFSQDWLNRARGLSDHIANRLGILNEPHCQTITDVLYKQTSPQLYKKLLSDREINRRQLANLARADFEGDRNNQDFSQ